MLMGTVHKFIIIFIFDAKHITHERRFHRDNMSLEPRNFIEIEQHPLKQAWYKFIKLKWNKAFKKKIFKWVNKQNVSHDTNIIFFLIGFLKINTTL